MPVPVPVPVLHLLNGCVFSESIDVMRWALTSDGAGGADDADGWWPRTQTADNPALLQSNDGAFNVCAWQ
jgi:hypothetical protein